MKKSKKLNPGAQKALDLSLAKKQAEQEDRSPAISPEECFSSAETAAGWARMFRMERVDSDRLRGLLKHQKDITKIMIIVALVAFAANLIPRPSTAAAPVADGNPFVSATAKPNPGNRVVATTKAFVDSSGVWRDANEGHAIEVMEWRRLGRR